MIRPKKVQTDKLGKSVAFRLTDEDFKRYQEKVRESGMTQSALFRHHVLTISANFGTASACASRAILLLSITSNGINQLAQCIQNEYGMGKINEVTFRQLVDQLEKLNRLAYEVAAGSSR